MSRWLRITLYTVAPFAFIGGTGLTIYYATGWGAYDLPSAARDLGAARKEAVAAGILSALPPAPAGSISGEEFRTRFNEHRIQKRRLSEFMLDGYSSSTLHARRKALEADRRHALNLAKITSVAWDTGSSGLFEVQAATSVLAVDAALAARLGQPDAAIENLRTARALGQLQAQSGSTMALLGSVSADSFTYRGAADCIRSWSHNPSALRRLQYLFAVPSWTADPVLVAKCEELQMRWSFQGLSREEKITVKSLITDDQKMPLPDFPVPSQMAADAILARHYRLSAKLLKAAEEGWAEMDALAAKELKEFERSPTLSRALVVQLVSPYKSIGQATGSSEARRQVILAAISRFLDPRSVLPEDPMSPGDKLVVAPRVNGFVIYSRGRDGLDDGGSISKADVGYEFKVK